MPDDEKPIRRLQREKKPAPSQWFVGEVEIEAIHGNAEIGLNQGRVHFHNGARTKWHVHLGDQVLYFVDGKGMAEDHGGTRIDCDPGDIVLIRPGNYNEPGIYDKPVTLRATRGEISIGQP